MATLGSNVRKKGARFWSLVFLAILAVVFEVGPWAPPIGLDKHLAEAYAMQSDINRDGIVDQEDLELFSSKYLGQDWEVFDWCLWLEEDDKYTKKQQLGELLDFIREYFQCGEPPPPEDPFAVVHSNDYPTRLALGPNGNLYVSDARAGSVFIYDPQIQVTGELKGLDSPVGVAVDSAGFIYVGNSRRERIEKYSPQGELVATFGHGMIRMPTDLTLDWDGNLYVADSQSNLVWVYDPNGALLRVVRKGELKSPIAVEIAYYVDETGQQVGELFVADKANYLVKVFDLQGNLLRSFGGFPRKGGMMGTTWYWRGKFISLQSLAVDQLGRVHALDCYMNRVQILDPVTGGFIDFYGEFGTGPGQLKLPLDIIINSAGDVIVANADNKRVEIIYPTP